MARKNWVFRRELRRNAAEARREERSKRSDEDQVAHLEAIGHGKCREIDRLKKRITKCQRKGK